MPAADDRVDALQTISVGPREFEQVRELARRHAGIELREGKESLVASRLSRQMRALRLPTVADYLRYVAGDLSGEALCELIDALTTNHTAFLREPAHFDFLVREVAPGWRGLDPISIWSAACATGEEPYSIAFTLHGRAPKPARILATDISRTALAQARDGLYQAARVAGLEEADVRRWFLRGSGVWNGYCRVRPEFSAGITFQRLNLMQSFAGAGRHAVIFCRNVMIYFSPATQQDLVGRLTQCLLPGGYLFIGHAESLNGIKHELRYVAPAIYQRPR